MLTVCAAAPWCEAKTSGAIRMSAVSKPYVDSRGLNQEAPSQQKQQNRNLSIARGTLGTAQALLN